jgi:hypothetical protein
MWSYAFVSILFCSFVVLFIVSWWRGTLNVRADARTIYNDVKEQKDHPFSAMGQGEFVALYARVNRIYWPAYVFLFFALAAIGSVLALVLMSFVRQYFYYGPLVWGFQTFFSLILFWVFALAIALKVYHAHKPGTLEDEFRRSNS